MRAVKWLFGIHPRWQDEFTELSPCLQQPSLASEQFPPLKFPHSPGTVSIAPNHLEISSGPLETIFTSHLVFALWPLVSQTTTLNREYLTCEC